jgi:hypothetical protein
MGLLTNGSTAFFGGAVSSITPYGRSRLWQTNGGRLRNVYSVIDDQSSVPNGANQLGWLLAPKKGGLASYFLVQGSTTTTANMALGLPADATLENQGDLVSVLILGASGLAALVASSSLTSAISGKLEANAPITASGDLSSALALVLAALAEVSGSGEATGTVSGKLEATATVTGDSDLAGVLALMLSAAASVDGSSEFAGAILGKLEGVASLTASGDLVGAEAVGLLTGDSSVLASSTARGFMAGNLAGETEVLTESGIAAAVWNALATAINNPSTAGAVLNRLMDLLEADETLEPNRARKFKRGTSTVLLEKNITGGSLTSTIEVRE